MRQVGFEPLVANLETLSGHSSSLARPRHWVLPAAGRTSGTPSSSTGPPSNTDFFYYYAETSGQYSKNFELAYDGRDCSQGISSVSFRYSMYGSNMGSLSVTSVLGGSLAFAGGLLEKAGDQGQGWKQATLQVNRHSHHPS